LAGTERKDRREGSTKGGIVLKFAIKTVAAGAIGTTSLLCATMAMSQEKLGEIVP